MQTFLPYASFRESARVLDYRRLGKQRVEAMQILRTIRAGESAKGWRNHPAVTMWRGHELALCAYGDAMCEEWKGRGYKDSLRIQFIEAMFEIVGEIDRNAPAIDIINQNLPAWLGDERLHLSHQSNLIRKDPEYYKLKFPNAPEGLAYFWVSKEEEYINA